jgi:hypothetical protein
MSELTRRYVVMAMAAEAPFDPGDPDAAFVLKPWKDPAALRALIAYRDNCYPELGREIDAWVRTIEGGPVIRGDVGRRNEGYAKPLVAPGSAAAESRTPTRRDRRRPARSRPKSRPLAGKGKKRRR